MNDTAIDCALELRFKVTVERAVRPLAATFARKRVLREELLAHLHSVYYDVLADCSSPEEACDRAIARFGDPRELTNELQGSVPRLNQLFSKIQWTPRPMDLMPWGILRWTIVFTMAFHGALAALLVAIMWLSIGRLQAAPFYGLAVIAICGIIVFYPFQLVAMQLGELSLERRLSANRQSLGLLLAASICFPIWLTLVYCGLADELTIPWRILWSSYVACFTLGPILAIWLGHRSADDRRYIQEWATLPIAAD